MTTVYSDILPNGDERKRRPRGSGTVYYLKSEGCWRARAKVNTKQGPKWRTIRAATKELAEEKLRELTGTDGYGWGPRKIKSTEQCVYFIQGFSGGPIKIGTALNLAKRFRNIQTCSPVALRVIHAIPNTGRETERKLHKHFAAYRLHGEWFEPTPVLLEYIHKLRSGEVELVDEGTLRDP